MTSVALHPARPLTPPDRPPDSPPATPSESSGTGSSEPISEQITRLFPKCRPRATTDVNLNPSPGHQHQANQHQASNQHQANQHQANNQHTNNTVVGAANKLDPDERRRVRERERDGTTNDTATAIVGPRDTATDRIIELAGGRELFSQSRTKAARRSRHSAAVAAVEERDRRRRSPSRNQTNNAPPLATQQTTQQPTHRTQRRNNEDFLRIQSNRHHHRASNSQAGGRPTPSSPTGPRPTSPPDCVPSPQPLNSHIISNTLTPTNIIATNLTSINLTSTNLTAPNLPTINLTSTNITSSPPASPPRSLAVVADGEVVVFDDIGDTWKGLRMNLEEASSVQNQNYLSELEKESVGHQMNTSAAITPSSYHHNGIAYNVNNVSVNEDDVEITSQNHLPESRIAPRVIGSLPIAEYEGSPRRYGVTRQCDNRTQDQILQNIPHTQSLLGQQQTPVSTTASLFPPRPGFPQRILSTKIEEGGNTNSDSLNILSSELSPAVNSTFDYLYEFSETRKVLEEFFKCPREDENKLDLDFNDLDYELHRQTDSSSSYVGQRLAKSPSNQEEIVVNDSPRKSNNSQRERDEYEHANNFLELSVGTGSSEEFGETEVGLQVGNSRNFTLSPETTDCDSNCGDLDSEMSLMMMENEFGHSGGLRGSSGDLGAVAADMTAAAAARLYTAMPVLEDGLSSGHASDTDNNNPTVMLMRRQISEIEREIVQRTQDLVNERERRLDIGNDVEEDDLDDEDDDVDDDDDDDEDLEDEDLEDETAAKRSVGSMETSAKITLDPLNGAQVTPPPPAPAPHRQQQLMSPAEHSTETTLKDIRTALQRKTLPIKPTTPEVHTPEKNTNSPVWIPRRQRGNSGESGDSCGHPGKVLSGDEAGDEEEADTDLETDRLLGQQRTDDQGFYDDKLTGESECPSLGLVCTDAFGLQQSVDHSDDSPSPINSNKSPKDKEGKKKSRNKEGVHHKPSVLIEGVLFRARYLGSTQLVCEGQPTKSTRMMQAEEAVSRIKDAGVGNQITSHAHQYGACSIDSQESCDDSTGLEPSDSDCDSPCHEPLTQTVCSSGSGIITMMSSGNVPLNSFNLNFGNPIGIQSHVMTSIPLFTMGSGSTGTVFHLHFLGSVEVEEECGRKKRKRLKKNMVEEAVTKIKAPEGENQPSTEVDLFISTEKIMVLNTDLKEIMMDHALRTISYIADIGDLVVLMARRRFVPHEMEDPPKMNRTPKMICHVFESEEAQFIAQSIGQAFQVAYMEFLKANGIEDHSFVKEMDYQEVLNSQEIFGDELQMFAKKEMQKEVVVPKAKGEILGVVIVESGWGSMLPTVVIANLAPAGAAARCGQLNIGDQIIAINGVSLVGLPLSTCQNYIKNSKNQTVVKLTVVPCAPVVEVKIKRPDTKYQLGFSVQNGVICSLLRGGIAERGGVRVGHRIIEINNQSVVAVPHEKIVNLLATSVGEILMKTMPTSMFRLLTGQENPVYI